MRIVNVFKNLRSYEKATIVLSGFTIALSGLTLVAVIVYAVLTYKQWREMKRSTDAVMTNFKTDERAWMGFKFMEGSLTLTVGKSFLVPTQLVNTGKTPAKNVHGSVRVGIVKRDEPLDFTYAPGHAHYELSAGTIFPAGFINESFEAEQHGPDKPEAILLTKPMLDDIFNGKSIIVVHGKIVYNDIFGTEHWTTYCRYVLHPEIISPECMRYNDTDDNK
jgi:hypothetical protein